MSFGVMVVLVKGGNGKRMDFFDFGEEKEWGLFLFLLLGGMDWWIKR